MGIVAIGEARRPVLGLRRSAHQQAPKTGLQPLNSISKAAFRCARNKREIDELASTLRSFQEELLLRILIPMKRSMGDLASKVDIERLEALISPILDILNSTEAFAEPSSSAPVHRGETPHPPGGI